MGPMIPTVPILFAVFTVAILHNLTMPIISPMGIMIAQEILTTFWISIPMMNGLKLGMIEKHRLLKSGVFAIKAASTLRFETNPLCAHAGSV